jgi:hAT family C-terminal dimerisation region
MAADGIPFSSNRTSIDWWSANQSRFPNIARLAKAYLVIPATSSASEVVFTVMGIC